MIKFTGAELPLDALIKQSGIHEEKKPRFYQGLSIGGKKMTNWARERGGAYQRALGSTPPLLPAAYRGGLAAVEWFLSDTPLRLYKEYGTKNVNDPRLKTLTKAHGGLDQTFGTWLKQRSKLPQICAGKFSTNSIQAIYPCPPPFFPRPLPPLRSLCSIIFFPSSPPR